MMERSNRNWNHLSTPNCSDYYEMNGLEFSKTPVPSPAAASSPISPAPSSSTSIPRFFASIAKTLSPSFLTSGDWSSATTPAASINWTAARTRTTKNGSVSFDDRFTKTPYREKRIVVAPARPKHPLGLDAYISNGEDADEEDYDPAPIVAAAASTKPLKSILRQTPARRMIETPISTPSTVKRSARHRLSDGSDNLFLLKRPKLSFNNSDSSIDTRRAETFTPAHGSMFHPFLDQSVPTYQGSRTGFSTRQFSSVEESPMTSRSSSRHSHRDPERPINIFNVPSRTNSSTSSHRTISASRTNSSRQGPIYSSSSHGHHRRQHRDPVQASEQHMHYNPDVRRIVKDLERLRGGSLSDVSGSRHSDYYAGDGRMVPLSSRSRSLSKRSSDYAYMSKSANSLPRLAALGLNLLYRPTKEFSQLPECKSRSDRPKKDQIESAWPGWIVSSGKVYQFAKPFPIDVQEPEERKMRRPKRSHSFQFANPALVSQTATGSTSRRLINPIDYSHPQLVVANPPSSAQRTVRFNLPPPSPSPYEFLGRNRDDGNF